MIRRTWPAGHALPFLAPSRGAGGQAERTCSTGDPSLTWKPFLLLLKPVGLTFLSQKKKCYTDRQNIYRCHILRYLFLSPLKFQSSDSQSLLVKQLHFCFLLPTCCSTVRRMHVGGCLVRLTSHPWRSCLSISSHSPTFLFPLVRSDSCN